MLTAIKPKSRQIIDAARTQEGVVFKSEHEMIRLQVKTPQIMRVTVTPLEDFSLKEHPGLVCKDVQGEFDLFEEADSYVITTGEMTVRLNRYTGAISYASCTGEELFSEDSYAPRTFEEFETYRLADGKQKTRTIQTADGKKEVIEEPLKISTGKSYHIRMSLNLSDEALYVFGQH